MDLIDKYLGEGNKGFKKIRNLKGASDEELMSYASEFENTKWNPDNKDAVLDMAKQINKEIKRRKFRGSEIKPQFEKRW